MANTKTILLSLGLALSLLLPAYTGLNKEGSNAGKTIQLSVLPGLRFDVPRFHVEPGQPVHIEFANTDDMDHNLLILQPGARENVVAQAMKLGAEGIKKQYIPDTESILWYTDILHAGEQETLSFTAPVTEGIYPYVCTLPGHGQIMYGAMYVNSTGEMPPLEKDTAISQLDRQAEHTHQQTKDHPYDLKAPYHYRLYVEGASPAAIAVHLPGDLSYCWDASLCDLRLMWKDGFLDNTELWKGHKDAKAEILGTIFYRQSTLPSLVISTANEPLGQPQFKGYKVVGDGYLEFHYQFGEIAVFETLRETQTKKGILREFRITGLGEELTLRFTPGKGVQCVHRGEVLRNGELTLDAQSARHFNVEYNFEKQ
ncbi:MAG: plastocyanin/azurin family copper-binding protein [Sphingobacterium sp.]